MKYNVTDAQAMSAVRTLLAYIGEDPDREGLVATPLRVIRAWVRDWGAGYDDDPNDSLNQLITLFTEDWAVRESALRGEMVMVRDISFCSHCEHHMAPFFGTASIAYIPGSKGVVGLSKLARITDHFSRRLQVQERMTSQIADFLAEHVAADVAVTTRATHMCMVSRGVKQSSAETITSAMRGAFYDDATTRAEFLQLSRRP